MSNTVDPDLYIYKAAELVDAEDEIAIEPVIECESVDAFPIFTPVWFTWNLTDEPVATVNEPVTVKLFEKLPEPETSKV